MIMLNEYEKFKDGITKDDYRLLLVLLNPIIPHITEELNEKYGLGSPICESTWPVYDKSKLTEDKKEIGVQVNGKLRGTITVDADTTEDEMINMSMENTNVKKFVEGKEIVKTIVIKNKIVNIVVK